MGDRLRFAMRRMLLRLLTAIQLTRLTMAFGAVSDVWFVILYTRAENQAGVTVTEMPLAGALLAGAVVAVGLFAYGAALNDVLDVRHDSAFSPDRPLPAGRIRVGQAIVVVVGALMVAVVGGNALGPWALRNTLITAAGILFYNAAARYIPSVGLVTIGLIHAAHMLIPNHLMPFMLPVWLVMTHAMAIGIAVHVLEDKRPRLDTRAIIGIVCGWLTWSGILLTLGVIRDDSIWPRELSAINLLVPACAVIGFVIVAWWKSSGVTAIVAAEKLKRYGAMWQSLYGAAWLCSLRHVSESIWIGILALAGFAAMTLIKEITGGLAGRPVTYR